MINTTNTAEDKMENEINQAERLGTEALQNAYSINGIESALVSIEQFFKTLKCVSRDDVEEQVTNFWNRLHDTSDRPLPKI